MYYVAPDGRADAPGTSLAEPTTLESAIARVVSGDAVILRGGVYRTGGLTLSQGITIQPYADEQPILKGTRVATEWEALRNNVWRTKLDHPLPGATARRGGAASAKACSRRCTGSTTTWCSWTVDLLPIGRLGRRARRAARSTSTTRPATSIIGTDPKDHLVEITAFDVALLRTSAAGTRQSQRPQGSGDPRADVHAVRLSRDRHRGQEAGSARRKKSRPTIRSARPIRPHTARKSSGTTLRARDHLATARASPATSAATD